ncbi:Crp/Fnr family transcriptional regulator [Martelella sp. HB161492]|uniref:Crp/Fnr family transcriptional regulator n=1 Tax=Martelella sp. HB161492 TaxID=2720726 RepID=UPI001591DF50|nr:Crp/Fnr family transcriptional regulator [Martelella sp. HB161492]
MLISSIARLRRYSAGEAIYQVGDLPDGVYGLVEGGIDVSIPRADGLDFTFHRAEAGFWIGDLALMTNARRLVSVYAAGDVSMLHLRASELRRLLKTYPDLIQEFYRLTYQNFATTFLLLSNLAMGSSEGRVALRLLLQLEQAPDPGGTVNISQSKLAELVALSEPTLQRALRRLRDMGCIEQRYNEIRVKDRVALLAVCGESEARGVRIRQNKKDGASEPI